MRVRLRRERLLALIAASPLSQNHWAIRLGLSRGHWSDLVNGRHPFPSPRTRERMLEAFGVPFEALFEIEPGGQSPEDTDFRMALSERYSVLSELGQGGMGTVYLAMDQRHGRQVALKVVSPEAVGGIGTAELLKEIAVVARLQHPHILPLFDSGESAGHPWYVMPLIRGGSLRDRMRREGRLPLEEVLRLLQGIGNALDYAHAERVLHCDVKPENILLDGRHPFVMDFGIARKLHSEAEEWLGLRKELDFSAGTPAYVSPEQANGEPLGPRSDVFSLACVAYELLAGRPPFEGTTTREIVTRRFRAPPPDLRAAAPEVPPAVAETLERAMLLDPERRPATPGALTTALRQDATVGRGRRALPAAVRRVAHRVTRATGSARLARPVRGLWQDARYVFRTLARAPRFSLGVLGSLALGMGVGLPAFSLADRLFLQPPAQVRDPDRVMSLVIRLPRPDGVFYSPGISGLDYTAISTLARTLDGAAAYAPWRPSLGRGPEAREIQAYGVTPSFFTVLGVVPAAGRFFGEAEDVLGAGNGPCVISWRFWQREYGGRADALGRTLRLGSGYYTVVGVAPEGFSGLSLGTVDVWVPIHVALADMQGGGEELFTTDRSWWVRIVGRLKPGVTLTAADDDATRVYRISGPRLRDPDLTWTMQWQSIIPGRALSRSSTSAVPLWLAGGAVLLLVLLAANLVNLFLARNIGRSRELAIRFAIGGGRARVLRLMLAESLVLALGSAAAAVALAVPATGVARGLLFPGLSWNQPVLDWRIAAAAAATALLVGMVVALGTSLYAARLDPALALKAAGSHQVAGASGRRFRLALVVAQAGVFTVLVLASAAFVRSLQRATSVDLGFRIDDLLVASSPLSVAGLTRDQRDQFYLTAQQQVAAIPGVTAVSIGYTDPWSSNRGEPLHIPGYEGDLRQVYFDVGTPEGLAALGLTLRRGRWIEPGDGSTGPPVVVVNEALVKQVWPHQDPLRQCIQVGRDDPPCRAVIGVVADHRFTGRLNDGMAAAYWVPVAQAAAYNYAPKLFIRYDATRGDPTAQVRRLLQGLAPDLPASDVHPVRDQYERLFPSLKMGATMFTVFGALALLVGALGLFSTMSYVVAERRKEFVIRSALGAEPRQVLLPVLARGLLLILAGVAAGLALAVAAHQRLDPVLFETRLLERGSLAVTVALALVAGLVAAWGPAWQAALADPARALQEP